MVGMKTDHPFCREAGRLLGAALGARAIPLAWLLLTRQPVRLAVALAGHQLRRHLECSCSWACRDGLFRMPASPIPQGSSTRFWC